MESWKNKVAVVTGAGGGIGAQIAEDLVKIGMTVIGFEPTIEKVAIMLDNVQDWNTKQGQLVPCTCDISKVEDLRNAFEGIVSAYGGVDLLINNAAIGKEGLISTGSIEDMKKIIDVNIKGLIACTRFAIDSMKTKDSVGRIININSVCGHYMPKFPKPTVNLYIASKKAMTEFTRQLRKEFKLFNYNINVSSISPGIVKTNIFETSGIDFIDSEYFENTPHLTVKDVSEIILMMLLTPNTLKIKEIVFHALNDD